MSIEENPFAPSFGEIPVYLAGRREIIDACSRAFLSERRRPELTTLFSGARREARCAKGADPAEQIMAHYTLPLRGHLREGFVQGLDRELFRIRSCRTLVCPTYIDERHTATCRVHASNLDTR